MKKLFLMICALFLFTACSEKQEYTNELRWPLNDVNIYVSSDFHWQEEGSNFRVDYLDESLLTLFSETINDKPAALLVCGDITNGGKLEEHLEIAQMLKSAEDEGVNIFVVMGNHDMDSNVDTDTLKEIYADFGFNTAIYNDDETMSYVTSLNEEIWLLSLDLNVYGDIESEMAGYISETTLLWIEEVLIKAQNENKMVIPFSHHNLVEHAMEDLIHHYNIENGEKLQDLLLNYGVPIYLSGHRHSSFIASIEKNERIIDELVIDMPSNYPFRYTQITFKNDNTIDYNIKTLQISQWAKSQGITDENLLNFEEFSKEEFEDRLKENSLAIDELSDNKEETEILKESYINVLTSQVEKTLWQDYEKLKESSALDLWKKYEDENIFSRWIPWILENQINDKKEGTLGPYR